MTNEQIKQAYVVGKAAKGVLRYRSLQKQAMMKRAGDQPPAPAGGGSVGDNSQASSLAGNSNKDLLNGYLTPTLTGAGITSILGALIQAARGKSVLNGLLVGALPGAALGAGYKYMSGSKGISDWMNSGSNTSESKPQ